MEELARLKALKADALKMISSEDGLDGIGDEGGGFIILCMHSHTKYTDEVCLKNPVNQPCLAVLIREVVSQKWQWIMVSTTAQHSKYKRLVGRNDTLSTPHHLSCLPERHKLLRVKFFP